MFTTYANKYYAPLCCGGSRNPLDPWTRRLRFSSDADIVRLTNARIIIIIIIILVTGLLGLSSFAPTNGKISGFPTDLDRNTRTSFANSRYIRINNKK